MLLVFLLLLNISSVFGRETISCVDKDIQCSFWVAENATKCDVEHDYQASACRRSCHLCQHSIPAEYSIKYIPKNLQPVAFLVGRWRSEFGGKADFPTIPRFTYGEELDFSIFNRSKNGSLKYTAFAWDNGDLTELHSEYGFITAQSDTRKVIMNTVMSNGFITSERGTEQGGSIEFIARRIARSSLSRDLPVLSMIRTWTLLDGERLEGRLWMRTITHRLMEHTSIVYRKIFP